MSRITITIDTSDTVDTKDFVFEVDEALNMGFKHPYEMWTVEPKTKRGRWKIIDDTEFRVSGWYCSLCNYQISDRYGKYIYCPVAAQEWSKYEYLQRERRSVYIRTGKWLLLFNCMFGANMAQEIEKCETYPVVAE